jgi:hypothetical protein
MGSGEWWWWLVVGQARGEYVSYGALLPRDTLWPVCPCTKKNGVTRAEGAT